MASSCCTASGAWRCLLLCSPLVEKRWSSLLRGERETMALSNEPAGTFVQAGQSPIAEGRDKKRLR